MTEVLPTQTSNKFLRKYFKTWPEMLPEDAQDYVRWLMHQSTDDVMQKSNPTIILYLSPKKSEPDDTKAMEEISGLLEKLYAPTFAASGSKADRKRVLSQWPRQRDFVWSMSLEKNISNDEILSTYHALDEIISDMDLYSDEWHTHCSMGSNISSAHAALYQDSMLPVAVDSNYKEIIAEDQQKQATQEDRETLDSDYHSFLNLVQEDIQKKLEVRLATPREIISEMEYDDGTLFYQDKESYAKLLPTHHLRALYHEQLRNDKQQQQLLMEETILSMRSTVRDLFDKPDLDVQCDPNVADRIDKKIREKHLAEKALQERRKGYIQQLQAKRLSRKDETEKGNSRQ